MQQKSEEERACSYVMWLLARRGYFSKELKEKMRRKGYPSSVVEKTLDFFRARGYLDDNQRSKSLIASEIAKGRGPKRIALLLKTKGALSDESLGDLKTFDQKESIQALLPKLTKKHATRERLIAALLRRGFEYREILFCIEQKERL